MKGVSEIMQDRFVRRVVVPLLVILGLFALPTQWAFAAYSYKITVAVSYPKGSAAAAMGASRPTNTKTTPCSTATPDQVSVTLTFDAGKLVADRRDVYVILKSPDNKLYTLSKSGFGSAPTITAQADLATLTSAKADATSIYLPIAANLGQGSQTEIIFGGFLNMETILTGTWQITGIIADASAAAFDFEKPDSWAAWDVGTLVVGMPWTGVTSNQTCASAIP